MEIESINDSNAATFFSSVSTDLVFIDFQAAWCRPCQTMDPIIKKVAKARDTITFCKVDVENNSVGLVQEYDVMSVPTFIIVESANREIVARLEGACSAQRLEELIDGAQSFS